MPEFLPAPTPEQQRGLSPRGVQAQGLARDRDTPHRSRGPRVPTSRRVGEGTLCVSEEEGQSPGRSRAGGPKQAQREAPKVWSSATAPTPTSCPAEPPGPGQSICESSSSICPASREERGGLHAPLVSQQQAPMSPSAAGAGEWGRAGPAATCRLSSARRHLGFAKPSAVLAAPGAGGALAARATTSHVQPQLTSPAAAAPGSASGRRSCRTRRC